MRLYIKRELQSPGNSFPVVDIIYREYESAIHEIFDGRTRNRLWFPIMEQTVGQELFFGYYWN